MTDTIKVQSALGGGKVALWERHPDHPGGEVFVAGDGVVEVALTREVQNRLRAGALVEVEAKPAARTAAASTATSTTKTTARKSTAKADGTAGE